MASVSTELIIELLDEIASEYYSMMATLSGAQLYHMHQRCASELQGAVQRVRRCGPVEYIPYKPMSSNMTGAADEIVLSILQWRRDHPSSIASSKTMDDNIQACTAAAMTRWRTESEAVGF